MLLRQQRDDRRILKGSARRALVSAYYNDVMTGSRKTENRNNRLTDVSVSRLTVSLVIQMLLESVSKEFLSVVRICSKCHNKLNVKALAKFIMFCVYCV